MTTDRMRIVCPDCGAQYDVDARMIPAAGRNVQCSACGHSWRQAGRPETADGPVADTPEKSDAPMASAETDGDGRRAVEDPDAAEATEDGEAVDVSPGPLPSDEIASPPSPDHCHEPDPAPDRLPDAGSETRPPPRRTDDETAPVVVGSTAGVVGAASTSEDDAVANDLTNAAAPDSPGEADRPPSRDPERGGGSGGADEDHAVKPQQRSDEGTATRPIVPFEPSGGDAADSHPASETGSDTASPGVEGRPPPGVAEDETDGAVSDAAGNEAAPVLDRDDVASGTPRWRARRSLKGQAFDVLREEVAREMAARQQDAREDPRPGRGAIDADLLGRMARLRARQAPDDPEQDRQTEVAVPSREDLLPDIAAISATLRPAADRVGTADVVDPVTAERRRRRRSRAGFLSMMAVTAALIGTYAGAPRLVAAAPNAAPAVVTYVDWANAARDGIDSALARLFGA